MFDFAPALDTIIVFVFIVIPGMAFRRFYFQGEFTKQYNSKSVSHALIASVPPGILIQLITIFSYSKYADMSELLIKSNEIFTGFKNDTLAKRLFEVEFTSSITIYILMMIIVSFLLAQLSWLFVRLLKWDRKVKLLRYSNHWNYYLKGELIGFKEYKSLFEGKTIKSVFADILVRIENDEPRLYSGKVVQYNINSNNELKYIYLTESSIYKKPVDSDKRVLKYIDGDVMIISAQDIININLKYEKINERTLYVKNMETYNGVIIVLTLLMTLILMFGNFDYTKSETILQVICLKFYIFFTFIFLPSIFFRNLINTKKDHRKERLFTQAVLFVLFSLIYIPLKYFLNIF